MKSNLAFIWNGGEMSFYEKVPEEIKKWLPSVIRKNKNNLILKIENKWTRQKYFEGSITGFLFQIF